LTGRAQGAQFLFGRFAPDAGPEVAERERAEAQAHERDHRVRGGLEHAADLPVAAFVDRHVDFRGGRARADDADLGGLAPAVVQAHAFEEPLHVVALQPALDDRPIGLLHAVTRVGEDVGEFAVVRHEQHARRVVVETPDGHEPAAIVRNQRRDRAAPPGSRIVVITFTGLLSTR
jgi:hypothetical protein